MDCATEPVWEKLRRREELRKAETATGGRKRYVSPLELFRQKLDAEAGNDTASTVVTGQDHQDEESINRGRRRSYSESFDSDHRSEMEGIPGPASPDEFEAVSRISRKASHCFSGPHDDDLIPTEQMTTQRQSYPFSKESWLKSWFGFKTNRKAMKSNLKAAVPHVEISTAKKDILFRNPLFKNKQREVGRQMSPVQVEESTVSQSHETKSMMGRAQLAEPSESSKTATANQRQCATDDRLRRPRPQNAVDGALKPRNDDDVNMDQPDYTQLLQIYESPGRFPLGRPGNDTLNGDKLLQVRSLRRCQSETRSPRGKLKSFSKIGVLRKALLRSRHYYEDGKHTTYSSSPDPSTFILRRSAVQSSNMMGQCSELAGDAATVSHVGTKPRRYSKKTGSPSNHGDSPCGQSMNGRVRQMATELEKPRNNGGSRSARGGAEDSSDQGFTAFVPFQGFAAFGNHAANARADTNALTRSTESQSSSVDGSRNSSNSKSSGKQQRRK